MPASRHSGADELTLATPADRPGLLFRPDCLRGRKVLLRCERVSWSGQSPRRARNRIRRGWTIDRSIASKQAGVFTSQEAAKKKKKSVFCKSNLFRPSLPYKIFLRTLYLLAKTGTCEWVFWCDGVHGRITPIGLIAFPAIIADWGRGCPQIMPAAGHPESVAGRLEPNPRENDPGILRQPL